jgi:tRNA-specific 2-thiouridylase
MAQRIVVAMSGGVDSSVAALLLKEQGLDVVGVFLRTGVSETVRPESRHRGCCSAADAHDARLVADQLGIPFYSLDFADDFRGVMNYFADEYVQGRTPNPCVVCNSQIKFGRLWRLAQSFDADYLATGHYCRIAYSDGSLTLQRAKDLAKDQTYVLFGIPPALLDRIRFPIGDLTKAQVRELARQARLPVADKSDSQDICFVGDGDTASFVQQMRPSGLRAGALVNTQGEVLGEHAGIHHFTVGQRKGLGLDRSKLKGQRRFVLEIIPGEAKVVVGAEEEGQVSGLSVERCNWMLPADNNAPCWIKWSHRSKPVRGHLRLKENGLASASFDKPQKGIAPGQAVVFYRDEYVIGGGWIAETKTGKANADL